MEVAGGGAALGSAQWACVGAWEEIANSCPSVPFLSVSLWSEGSCLVKHLLLGLLSLVTDLLEYLGKTLASLCSSDSPSSVCPTWHTASGSLLLQMASPWVRSYTRTVGPGLPKQLLLQAHGSPLQRLSMLMATAVACSSHHLLSWSKKKAWILLLFRITATPQHFPKWRERLQKLSLWERPTLSWPRWPRTLPAWTNHGANGRRCCSWISLGGTAQWSCVGLGRKSPIAVQCAHFLRKPPLQGLQILLLWGKTNRKIKQKTKTPARTRSKKKSRKERGWLLGNCATMTAVCMEADDTRSHTLELPPSLWISVLGGKTHQFRTLPWWNFGKGICLWYLMCWSSRKVFLFDEWREACKLPLFLWRNVGVSIESGRDFK